LLDWELSWDFGNPFLHPENGKESVLEIKIPANFHSFPDVLVFWWGDQTLELSMLNFLETLELK